MPAEHVRVARYADSNLTVRENSLTTPQATTRSSTPTGQLSPRQRPSTSPPPGTASATVPTSRPLPPLSARATRAAPSRATTPTTTVRRRISTPAVREKHPAQGIDGGFWANGMQPLGIAVSVPAATALADLAVSSPRTKQPASHTDFVQSLSSSVVAVVVAAVVPAAVPVVAVVVLPARRVTVTAGPVLGTICNHRMSDMFSNP